MMEVDQAIRVQKGKMTQLLSGEQVVDLLCNTNFMAKWDLLYEQCPWATVFQKREFVSSWYQHYTSRYLPILIHETTAGKLTGLLTLAKCEKEGITGAGANQAEYQVWLAEPSNSNEFIQSALSQLRSQFPSDVIHLKYLPSNTPVNWVNADSRWGTHCTLQLHKQPLMVIEDASIASELKKKNRREKINRLKRLGELKFERITELNDFVSLIDMLATQFDFRKGATVNLTPFKSDPFKRDFLVSLFEQNLLHVTLLKLNNEAIASNVGAYGRGWVHLQGLNTHSPYYAKHSPGILHFLMLGRLLAEENFDVFDLTPGGDSYKNSLANSYVHAYELTISNHLRRYTQNSKIRLANYIKQSFAKRGIKPTAIKDFKRSTWILFRKLRLVKSLDIRSSFEHIMQLLQLHSERVYRFTNDSISPPDIQTGYVNIQKLEDLLNYEDSGSLRTRWEFLSEAMRRFESGERCYTWGAGGRLLACTWQGAARAGGPVPEGAPVLRGLYCHRTGRSGLANFLAVVARKATQAGESEQVYALARNKTIGSALKSAGFSHMM
ncbi:GNAT family N-acetyltransferase [Pontibacter sp. JH31]|uniref:GNAT family N-acetyltransferase n=1 Tax=Pontibacter aquaedesilientis TaxID=2766980 RepID=A0ABR7XHG6_9BACT|nr:GNAT family N-acetyltransferase [Pontibacter aquaedesilientis]MBD1397722.1 GNAT family N-acetyltransferase [Pontibacter aquaedesilientis]